MERLHVRLWTHDRLCAPRCDEAGRGASGAGLRLPRTGRSSQRRQMTCLSSRLITRPSPRDTGAAALSEYPQAGGGCSREERKEVSEDEEEEVVALMPSG